MPLHSAITSDSELHEPKGVASAADGLVYTADGAGSGNWESIIEETSTSRASTGLTHDITGLGDYSAIIVTLPNIRNADNNNEWLRFFVGNEGGFTTSAVYFADSWYHSGAASYAADSNGWLQYSYTASPTADQSMRLMFTNWNKEYYTVGHLIGGCQSLPRMFTYFIREQKAYDRLRITSPSNYASILIGVQGLKG